MILHQAAKGRVGRESGRGEARRALPVEGGADPSHWRVELEPAPLTFQPVGMAAEALRGAEVEGYDASFTTRPDLMGPLSEALESSPPVDEAYYYSLTGRFETLTHALDLLVEIERRKRDKQN